MEENKEIVLTEEQELEFTNGKGEETPAEDGGANE